MTERFSQSEMACDSKTNEGTAKAEIFWLGIEILMHRMGLSRQKRTMIIRWNLGQL